MISIKILTIFALIPLILSIGIAPALPFAHSEEKIPKWIQDTAMWWSEGVVSDDEFLSAIEFLIKEGIIQVPDNLIPISEEQIKSYPTSKPITEQPNIIIIMPDDVGWPTITNLRLDPFERAGLPDGDKGSLYYKDFFVFEFWRFVQAQQQIGELVPTFIEFPPMQDPASFNLDAVKKNIEKMRALGD